MWTEAGNSEVDGGNKMERRREEESGGIGDDDARLQSCVKYSAAVFSLTKVP